jgi:hypothetical protein
MKLISISSPCLCEHTQKEASSASESWCVMSMIQRCDTNVCEAKKGRLCCVCYVCPHWQRNKLVFIEIAAKFVRAAESTGREERITDNNGMCSRPSPSCPSTEVYSAINLTIVERHITIYLSVLSSSESNPPDDNSICVRVCVCRVREKIFFKCFHTINSVFVF